MSIEASVARIEAQNAVIAEVLVGVFETQKAHSDMLKTLATAAPAAIDTTELDASIASTDAILAKLAPASADGTATGAAADTSSSSATAAALLPDPATGIGATGAAPAPTAAQQPDAPVAGSTIAA